MTVPKHSGSLLAPSFSAPRSAFGFVANYLRRHWLAFTGLALSVILAASCSVAVQYAMKLLVDAMAGNREGANRVWHVLIAFMALIASESVLWRLSAWLGSGVTIQVGREIRLDMLTQLSGCTVGFFHDHRSGSLAHRITATAGTFGALVNRCVWDIAPPAVNFIGAVLIFSSVDWRMAAVLCALVSATTTALVFFGSKGERHHRRYAERASAAGGELADVLTNMWAVKSFASASDEIRRLDKVFAREARSQRGSWMLLEKIRVLHDLALWGISGTMLIWAIALWQQGSISPGDVVAISALAFRISYGSRDVALALAGVSQNLAFLKETLHVADGSPAIVDRPDAHDLLPLGGAISFERVSFGYSHDRPVLHDLSLHIGPGERVGIVGRSGAGKSTLVHLLQRFSDPSSGLLSIDGQPLRGLRQDSLRKAISVVPQDVTLFHRTILQNIRFGRPDAADDDVLDAARSAFCDGFINELPHGYQTIVGERGMRLSGGERQRIGIARAFLKDAPILVLDEATSALDSHSEEEIQRALSSLARGKTVLAIAHRLSTLTGFDRIVVLGGGRIVEEGSPRDLILRDGVFAEMWRGQSHRVSQ